MIGLQQWLAIGSIRIMAGYTKSITFGRFIACGYPMGRGPKWKPCRVVFGHCWHRRFASIDHNTVIYMQSGFVTDDIDVYFDRANHRRRSTFRTIRLLEHSNASL